MVRSLTINNTEDFTNLTGFRCPCCCSVVRKFELIQNTLIDLILNFTASPNHD